MATRLVHNGMPMEHIRKILGRERTNTIQNHAKIETSLHGTPKRNVAICTTHI